MRHASYISVAGLVVGPFPLHVDAGLFGVVEMPYTSQFTLWKVFITREDYTYHHEADTPQLFQLCQTLQWQISRTVGELDWQAKSGLFRLYIVKGK